MKITKVWSSSLPSARGHAVRVATDSGLVGFAVTTLDLQSQIAALGDSLLIGEDPRATVALWERMSASCAERGSGFLIESVAALDAALWDVKAKANDEPLWRTLGGARPRANAHLGGFNTASDDEFTRRCRSLVTDFGYRGAVIGFDSLESTAHRLALLRESLRQSPGAPPALMLAGDERWSAKDAIRCIRELEREFDLTWIETPTHRDDVLGLKRISNEVRGAVCGGAALANVRSYLSYLQRRCVDVVQIDVARTGVTGALQIAEAAFGFELPVALAPSVGNFAAHLASVMPSFMSMEIVEPRGQSSVWSDVNVVNGWAEAGDQVGHGLAVNSGAP